MKPQALLQELERAADQLAVKVSYEPMAATVGHGGLCRVKGQYRVIIDKRATNFERAETLAVALAQLDTSDVRMHRRVREWVDYYRARMAASLATRAAARQ
jgi:hypothetical protein